MFALASTAPSASLLLISFAQRLYHDRDLTHDRSDPLKLAYECAAWLLVGKNSSLNGEGDPSQRLIVATWSSAPIEPSDGQHVAHSPSHVFSCGVESYINPLTLVF